MLTQKRLWICLALLTASMQLSDWTLSVLADQTDDEQERFCNAELLIENARRLKAETGALNASMQDKQKAALLLIAQAKSLAEKSKKLNLRIEERVNKQAGLKGKVDSNRLKGDLKLEQLNADRKSYDLHLKEFQDHARLYNGHLQDYEKQLQKLQATDGELKSNCSQYADHVEKYHIPGIRAPHICLQLQWQEQSMQKAANEFQANKIKAAKTEAALAQQESQVLKATQRRIELEQKMIRQASFDELEASSGVMLLKEFQAIEREYRNLQAEHKRLISK